MGERFARMLLALTSLCVGSCGAPAIRSTPTAEIVKVRGPWSYCETQAGLSLSHENAPVLESHVLHARANDSI